MRKDNMIMSLWMLLVLLMMLSTCCDELKEDYKPKSAVNWDTVEETDTEFTLSYVFRHFLRLRQIRGG